MTGVAEMTVTDSMHSRKRACSSCRTRSSSLPGGLGTLDETIEIITWRQLRLHDKPILLCDVKGSAAPLLAAIEAAIAHGFARPMCGDLYEVVDGVPAALERIATLAGAPGAQARCCRGGCRRDRLWCWPWSLAGSLAVSGGRGYMPRRVGRSVAQPGRALCSGRRGRRFESSRSDHPPSIPHQNDDSTARFHVLVAVQT